MGRSRRPRPYPLRFLAQLRFVTSAARWSRTKARRRRAIRGNKTGLQGAADGRQLRYGKSAPHPPRHRQRHRMGDAPPGLACDAHARTLSRGAWRLDGAHSSRHWPPRKPHKRFSGLRMNRTTSELKIALLRSAPAPWSIEFLGSRKIRVTPPISRQSLFCQTGFQRPVWVAPKMARVARSLWGMPGGLGIASAIEPAGGVSPLRGGAGVCRMWSYRQGVAPNYRS